jgi:membrane fusion protein, multidrug efflux system
MQPPHPAPAPIVRTRRAMPNALPRTLAAACLLGTLLPSCEKEQERAVVAQPVRTFLVEDANNRPFRQFPGEVVSPRTGRLSFEISGRLIEFPIQNGQLVKKGDLIGQLDTADFIANRDAAQAAFAAAKANFERSESLQQRGAVARAVLDRARQELDTADASLRTASRALDETRLLAPFDGRIAERIARELQNVRAQEQVAILEDISTLEIEINIPERDMMVGGRGLTVEEARRFLEAKVEFSLLPGEPIDLRLETFSTRANPVSRTFLVSFAFDPPESQNILPGMTGNVMLRRSSELEEGEAGGPDIRLVPVEAVVTVAGKSTVWRLNPETMTVSPVTVEISSIKGGAALIRAEALKSGDEIVASGARFLAEGTAVTRMEVRNP